MLANYHYRLPVRRYIIELFDLPLSRQTAGEIVRAGEELKNRRDGSSLELNPTSIAAADVILDGIEADYSDDEESNPDGEVSLIPLQVLRPLILLHGFVLS
jgi:rapamycin-insensitive companion of mTOR